MSNRKVWQGCLQLGLLTIPIYMYCGARNKSSVSLTNLHKACKRPVKMPKWCPECETRLNSETDLCKGYELPDGGFILLSDEELDSIAPASEKTMEITECVKWCDVDPLYLAESFFVLPDGPGQKGYGVLVRALTESGRVALAQITKSNREHMVLLRPKGNGLMAHFLYYPNEMSSVAEFDTLKPPVLTTNEAKLAKQLIENLASEFKPQEFENGYEQRLSTLINSKLDSKVAAPAPIKAQAKPTDMDLEAMLTKSLVSRPKRRIVVDEEPTPKSKKRRAA